MENYSSQEDLILSHLLTKLRPRYREDFQYKYLYVMNTIVNSCTGTVSCKSYDKTCQRQVPSGNSSYLLSIEFIKNHQLNCKKQNLKIENRFECL